jgi:hypothetical protein
VRRATVLLAYALDRRGKRVAARTLDARSRRGRAPFHCPACEDLLVPHLGKVRQPHFAHQPGARCALASPETALHHNAKERLLELCAEAFAGRRTVELGMRCPGCRRPAPLSLQTIGDGAVLEGKVGALRADVLVTRRGAPALAFEVKVAHAVDEEKETALAALAVPAAEIDANADWEEEGEREGRPMTRIAVARSFAVARCDACATKERADREVEAGGEDGEIAALEAYRARGLMGPRPGPPLAVTEPLGPGDVARFRCRGCGSSRLELGVRLARHACPGEPARAVVWRGYDGAAVVLGGT